MIPCASSLRSNVGPAICAASSPAPSSTPMTCPASSSPPPSTCTASTSALENYGLLARFGPQPIDELIDFGRPRDAAFREVLADQLLYRFDLRWELIPGMRWVRSELTAAAAQAPLSAQALEQLALSELTLGDRGQALRHARAALALDPSRSEAQRITRDAG